MDIHKEFDNWYQTEGIRTLPDKNMHWHTSFQQHAFLAGANLMAKQYQKTLDEMDLKISELKKLHRKLLRKTN